MLYEVITKDSYSFAGPALLLDQKLEKVEVKDLDKGAKSYGKEATWTSLQSKYFIMAGVPLKGAAEKTTRITSYNVCYTKLLR